MLLMLSVLFVCVRACVLGARVLLVFLVLAVLVILVSLLIFIILLQWRLMAAWCRESLAVRKLMATEKGASVESRSKSSQAPTTYRWDYASPRFQPLPSHQHAWPASRRLCGLC